MTEQPLRSLENLAGTTTIAKNVFQHFTQWLWKVRIHPSQARADVRRNRGQWLTERLRDQRGDFANDGGAAQANQSVVGLPECGRGLFLFRDVGVGTNDSR